MTSRTRIHGLSLLALVVGGLAPTVAADEPEYEMTEYQFVLLRDGPDRRPMGEREIQRHQEEHLAYLGRLREAGQLLVWGPLDRGGELRRAIVLDAGSVENAEAIMREDSWVKAGSMTAEVHPWWAAKGILQEPEHELYMERCVLALLKRPPGAPDLSTKSAASLGKTFESTPQPVHPGDRYAPGATLSDRRAHATRMMRETAAIRIAIAGGR